MILATMVHWCSVLMVHRTNVACGSCYMVLKTNCTYGTVNPGAHDTLYKWCMIQVIHVAQMKGLINQ